jgi:poly-beta-1,6-N-acetyl-D-glucosamine biosynthesis protein PgaD
MVTQEGYQAFLSALPNLLFVIAALSSALAIWALYNFTRFKGVERRLPTSPVNNQALQELFGVSENDLNSAQTAKIIVVYFDQEDKMKLTFKE